MKNLLFLLLFTAFALVKTDINAQVVAWPNGAATFTTCTSTDTTLTVKNTLTFLNYGALTGIQKLTLTAGQGLKTGSMLYLLGVSSGTEGFRLPALVPAAYDTILVTNAKTGTILLMWNGSSFNYANTHEY